MTSTTICFSEEVWKPNPPIFKTPRELLLQMSPTALWSYRSSSLSSVTYQWSVPSGDNPCKVNKNDSSLVSSLDKAHRGSWEARHSFSVTPDSAFKKGDLEWIKSDLVLYPVDYSGLEFLSPQPLDQWIAQLQAKIVVSGIMISSQVLDKQGCTWSSSPQPDHTVDQRS